MVGIPRSSIKEFLHDEERGSQLEGELQLGKKKGIAREEGSKRKPA